MVRVFAAAAPQHLVGLCSYGCFSGLALPRSNCALYVQPLGRRLMVLRRSGPALRTAAEAGHQCPLVSVPASSRCFRNPFSSIHSYFEPFHASRTPCGHAYRCDLETRFVLTHQLKAQLLVRLSVHCCIKGLAERGRSPAHASQPRNCSDPSPVKGESSTGEPSQRSKARHRRDESNETRRQSTPLTRHPRRTKNG